MLNLPICLSPAEINSFAYYTFRDRLPVIITRIVDYIYRNKKFILDTFGDDKIECVKYITSELSRLRHELTTNKAITEFEGYVFEDEELWNKAIVEERNRLKELKVTDDGEIHWFETSFLFGENYMYRRIWDIILKSGLPTFDQFYFEKEELLQRSLPMMHIMTTFLKDISSSLKLCDKSQLYDYFDIFLKMSLWGNEVDLSLSVGDQNSKVKKEHPKIIVENNNSKLLIDDTKVIFDYLYNKCAISQKKTLTLVLDNSGSELLADLHLVDFLLSSGLISTVVIMTKSFPWYVSDVTKTDFDHTLEMLLKSDNELYKWLSKSISCHIAELRISIQTHFFFTLPHPFCRMKVLFPDLYSSLSTSSLIIFKGDLNYRKLVSDLSWCPVSTSFQDSLLGFIPAPIVALRVLKCDVQVGLSKSIYDSVIAETPNDWMTTSKYGVVQSCGIHL